MGVMPSPGTPCAVPACVESDGRKCSCGRDGADAPSRLARQRAPQLADDVKLELRLPPTTEEWADDLLRECGGYGWDVERTDQALFVRTTVGGNCAAIHNGWDFLREAEEALDEGEISVMVFTLMAIAVPPGSSERF